MAVGLGRFHSPGAYPESNGAADEANEPLLANLYPPG